MVSEPKPVKEYLVRVVEEIAHEPVIHAEAILELGRAKRSVAELTPDVGLKEMNRALEKSSPKPVADDEEVKPAVVILAEHARCHNESEASGAVETSDDLLARKRHGA